MPDRRRMKRMAFDVEGLFNNGLKNVFTPHLKWGGIPNDATFEGMLVDRDNPGKLYIYISSDEFDIVPESSVVPDTYMTISQYMCPQYVQAQLGEAHV